MGIGCYGRINIDGVEWQIGFVRLYRLTLLGIEAHHLAVSTIA